MWRCVANTPQVRNALGSARDNVGKTGNESSSTANLPTGPLADLPTRSSRPSGLMDRNCVSGHRELTKHVLGHDIGELPPHTMPQELADRMEDVKTEPQR